MEPLYITKPLNSTLVSFSSFIVLKLLIIILVRVFLTLHI